MEKLLLNLTKYTKDPERFPLIRKYFSVKIEHYAADEEIEVIKEIGNSIQRLTISHTVFEHAKVLRDIFGSLKILKTLSLIRVQINIDDEIEPENFPLTLEKVEMIQVDHKVLKQLQNFQLLNLVMIDVSNKQDSESLVKFLSSQKKLESMTIESLLDDEGVLFDFDYSKNFSFKLKKFSVLYSHVRNMETFEKNFVAFLKLHERNMKKLKVEGNLSQHIYKFIMTNMKILEEVEVNVGGLPQEASFYDVFAANRSLKIFKLNGTINRNNLIGFKGILTLYPNIERISLADTDAFVANDVFHLMSVKLGKLSRLSVLNLHESFTGETVFPSLKHYSIRVLNDVNQWKNFISRNETIETLSVGWIKRDQVTAGIINAITDMRNLRHLKFGGRFIASKRIYDAIKSDYKKLRTLQLMVANYDEIKNLSFVFPLNKHLWLPQCPYFDEGHDREPVNDW